MKHFILENNLIDSIKKNINMLKNFYNENIDNLFFNKFEYDTYRLSFLYSKKDIGKNNIFNDIISENKNLIIPSINISRMLPQPKQDEFIAHQHTFDLDSYIYHYVIKHNDKCGMIIEDEYLPYHDDLVFGFEASKAHIAFNFGETVKDSYEFIVSNPKYTLDEWYNIKIKAAISNNYSFIEMNKEEALKKINYFKAI